MVLLSRITLAGIAGYSLSSRDASRITALILGLITIIEKACEDTESPERLKGSVSFSRK